jgi:hypothetical protein
MGEENKQENLDQALLDKVSEFYSEEETKQVTTDSQEEGQDNEDKEDAEQPQENTEEVKQENSLDDKEGEQDLTEEENTTEKTTSTEDDFNRSLSGFQKEFKELVQSIEDKDLQQRIIEAGKHERADIDRKRQQLGESGKLYQLIDEAVKDNRLNYTRNSYPDLIKNYLGFDVLFSKDPQTAIKNLAQSANIQLDSLIEKPKIQDNQSNDDYDDYRTPEEKARDEKIAKLEQEINHFKNQNTKQSQVEAESEIQEFANSRDSEGNLKYPHFDKVRANMGLFFNDNYPDMTLDKAYQKAILMDDELIRLRDADILKKAELRRKQEIEKAKKLKKQSIDSTRINTRSTNPDANLENIVSQFGF